MMKRLIFILMFVFLGVAQEKREVFDEIYCEVNGDVISVLDMSEAVEMNGKLKKLGFPLSTDKKQILDYIVETHLVEQDLHKKNIYISDVDVTNQVSNIGRSNNIKTIDDFKKIIEEADISWEYFLNIQRGQIYRQYMNRYLPLANQPTAKEIRDYYNANKSDFFVDKMMYISSIYLQKPDLNTFSELSKFTKKANEVRSKINAQSDFEAMKQKYSDLAEKPEWKVKEDYENSPRVWEELQGLQKNEISQPLDVVTGMYIIKLLDVKSNTEMPYEKIQEKISAILLQKKNEVILKDKIKELKDNAFIKVYKD